MRGFTRGPYLGVLVCCSACADALVTGGGTLVAPELAAFTATPSSVTVGTPTEVTWAWTYDNTPIPVPTCIVDPSVGAIATGTATSVNLSADTLFTLACTNAMGSDTAQTTVTTAAALVAPAISTFSAAPSTVAVGAPTDVTWAWTYDNTPIPTPTCVVDNSVGTVANGTVTSVTLSTDTLFVLTCTNTAGSATKTTTIFTASVPVQPSTIAGNASPCPGATAVAYAVSNVAGVSYDWVYSGAGATITAGAGTSAIAVDYSGSATSGTWTVTPSNIYGSGTARTLVVTMASVPTQPSTITGDPSSCQGAIAVAYSVTDVTGVTYTWSYGGTGATFSGEGTNSITVDYSASATSGTWTVTPSNTCGDGAAQTSAVTLASTPAQPSAITGNASPCQGATGLTYSVTGASGVTHTWSYGGTGATFSGQGTNSITVDYSPSATSGTWTVTPSNTCGAGATQTSVITMGSVPAQPSTITGNVTPYEGSSLSYSVTNVAGTTYTWSFPAGWTQTGGGTTDSVTVTIGAGSGTIQATPSNGCGSGTARTLTVNVTQPEPFVQVTAGIAHTCGITGKGKAFCWGSDSDGQLGDDAILADKPTPTAVDTTNLSADDKAFVQIAAGGYHTCGITGKGKAFCWGYDDDGELGDDATPADKPIPTAVDTTNLPAGDKAFVRIATGVDHSCGITGKGKAFCWGYDGYGQLGDDATLADKHVPAAVDTTNLPADDKAFVQLAAGGGHVCGITGKGKAFCWGSDSDGQLGDDAPLADKPTPTAVDTTNLPADDKAFVQLAAGGYHTCGVTGKGKAFCWGYDGSGALGDDATPADKPTPTAVDTTNLAADDKAFVQLATGYFHTCGFTGKGKAFCWGNDGDGELGDDATLVSKLTPTAVGTTNLKADDKAFVQMIAGAYHTCGITGKGKAFCWGSDSDGQLGDDTTLAYKPIPTAVGITNLPADDKAFVQLATGETHTCGITGRGKAFCWGNDTDGQLGNDATFARKPIPTAVDTTNLPADDKAFVQIAVGVYHTCGLTGKGKAFCWGSDGDGELGDDATLALKPTPTAVDITNLPTDDKAFVRLATGSFHTCGITGRGKAFCWGDDSDGQLGDDAAFASKPLPTAVDTTNLPADDKAFVQLAPGRLHTCGITGKGKAFCWGYDAYGELGDDAALASKPTPTAVDTTNLPADDKAFVRLAANQYHTCGITEKGKAFCWGNDGDGQLGDDVTLANKPMPTAVDTTTLPADDKAFVQLAAGSYHTCGITGAGKAFCWGYDGEGELGDDAILASKPLPIAVDATNLSADDKAFVHLAAGARHTCGVTGTGKAFCWGHDDYGELGDDAGLIDKPTPTAVNLSGL
jgi:alpha-tubulin suppressor-like RCC1 family protein